MFCRFCGTTLPADSTFCQSCGKSLTTAQSSGAAAAPALDLSPPPEPKCSGVRTSIVLGLFVVLGLLAWSIINQQSNSSNRSSAAQPVRPFVQEPQPRVMALVDTAFTLNAAQGTHWNFTVPANATDVRVEGTFTASGGTGNDVEVYLLNDDEFVNWQQPGLTGSGVANYGSAGSTSSVERGHYTTICHGEW